MERCLVCLALVYVLSAQLIAPAGTWSVVGKSGPPRPPADRQCPVVLARIWHARSELNPLARNIVSRLPEAQHAVRQPERKRRAARLYHPVQGTCIRHYGPCDAGGMHGCPAVDSRRGAGTRQVAIGLFRDMAVSYSPEG